MSTPAITLPAPRALSGLDEAADRYEGIKQYSLVQIVAVWAAAAVPMGVLAWIVAPSFADRLSGAGDVPMFKALILLLTVGLVWQFVLVVGLVWLEQRSLRWSTIRQALWLRSPRSPRSGRVGGRLWLILIPLFALFAVEELIPAISARSSTQTRVRASSVGTGAGSPSSSCCSSSTPSSARSSSFAACSYRG